MDVLNLLTGLKKIGFDNKDVHEQGTKPLNDLAVLLCGLK